MGKMSGQSVIDVIKVSLNGLNVFLHLQKKILKKQLRYSPSVSNTDAGSFLRKYNGAMSCFCVT